MDNNKDKDTAKECDKKECSETEHDAPNLQELFASFSRLGDRESDGETITLKNIDKWLKQAGMLGDKNSFSNDDTATTFSKIAKTKKRVDLNEFQKILEQLASDKKMEAKNIIDKLQAAGQPGTSNVTTPVTSGAAGANLERMTDTTLYTGAHKERFDEEGRGRGIEGREETSESAGYVTGYKEKDTYDKKRKE